MPSLLLTLMQNASSYASSRGGGMRILTCIALFLGTAFIGAAEDLRIDPNQQYLVLATNRTSTMQTELDIAAKQGFRVVSGMAGDDEIIYLLERVPQPAEPYRYRLLATERTSTMEGELNMWGRAGYRFLPQTTLHKGSEIILLMEGDPELEGQRFEYQLLATHRTST